MGRPIHEKINLLLTERGQKKKELAQALGISPQTMTDITKGRSSVTLQHLRGLVHFFNLRADYWLDDGRDEPGTTDQQSGAEAAQAPAPAPAGGDGRSKEPPPAFVRVPSSGVLMEKMRSFVRSHEGEWERVFGPMKPQEKEWLGLREERRAPPRSAGGNTSQVATD